MCKKFVEGSLCDQCKPGFFNLSTANSDGCDPCSCHPAGSVSGLCSSSDGQCDCKETANPELAGKRCVSIVLWASMHCKYNEVCWNVNISIWVGFYTWNIDINGKKLSYEWLLRTKEMV